jgi:hypothetical protein
MKLNLGCGKTIINGDGWVNVDAVHHPKASRAPDVLCDIRKLPFQNECADVVMGIHVWEHIVRWECDEVIDEWKRVMKPGAELILEMPDLLKCCRNILDGVEGKTPDQLGMWGLYGDVTLRDPLMLHPWAWTFKTLKPFLVQHGFINIREHETHYHLTGKRIRDFRITALKPR